MKVTVIGKTPRQGVSKKSGKEYDCVIVYATYDGYKVEGQACDAFWLNAADHPFESIQIGASYAVERTPKGFVTGFYRISD